MERQCHLCHHTCHECDDNGPVNCTSCDKDKFGVQRYLFQGECRDVCPEGFFPSWRRHCELCAADCVVCEAADRCLHCSQGHNLRDGRCVPLECGEGEVADSQYDVCQPCEEGCRKCKRNEERNQGTLCVSCEDSYYKLGSDCYRFCPERTYSVSDTMTCTQCQDPHCINCDQNQCYWCEEGFYVSDGVCVDHCKEGFFVDEESQDCEPCHRSCQSCGGPRYNDCDTCEEGFALSGGECVDHQQTTICPPGKFQNDKGECEQCYPSCKTCSGPGKKGCQTCTSGRFLTGQQTCVSHCPPGAFANQTSSQCQDCLPGCVLCQEAQRCQRCSSGHSQHYLEDGLCVVECKRGFPVRDQCQPCAPQCASCLDNASHCLSCAPQYFLLDHSCISQCPLGYFPDHSQCLRCPPDCRKCSDDGLCQECAKYFFLYWDGCVDDCPAGYFPSEVQKECMRCHVDCASCDGPDSDDCHMCRNPKAVRYNGECLPRCPVPTYYDPHVAECRDCDRSCLTCSGPEPSSCLSCDGNMRRDETGHCVWYSRCSLRSYMDTEGQCQLCHPLCHRCSGPGKDQCLNCNAPRLLLNNTCIEECPAGYYDDREELACRRCHDSCETCEGRHSLQCVTCKPGLYHQGQSCVESCSESHYGNPTSRICEHCDPSCSRCLGPGNGDCLSCREDYLYLRQWGKCLQSCPRGYYQDDLSNTCRRCHPTCHTCNDEGALACQSCYQGYDFFGGICESQCLLGFYATPQVSDSRSTEPNCVACDPTCVDCRGPSQWNCTVCPALQLLSDDGRCLSCCGNRTRPDGAPVPRECCDCHASREECVLGSNFVLKGPAEVEVSGSSARLFVTSCLLMICAIGGAIFAFLQSRSRSGTNLGTMKTKAGGYEKLDSRGGAKAQPTTSSFGEYSDRIIRCEDDEDGDGDDDDDEEDDIVYMGQDGTVYRKFRYGLLDEDEEIELEYDDESYSFR